MSYDLGKLLEPYRRCATQTDLALIVDDAEAIRVLASWQHVDSRWTAPERDIPEGDTSTERWRWLWEDFLYDRAALAQFAKLCEARTKQLVITCAMRRILYPDRTISKPARGLIAEHVRARYPGRKRGRPTGSKDLAAPSTPKKKAA